MNIQSFWDHHLKHLNQLHTLQPHQRFSTYNINSTDQNPASPFVSFQNLASQPNQTNPRRLLLKSEDLHIKKQEEEDCLKVELFEAKTEIQSQFEALKKEEDIKFENPKTEDRTKYESFSFEKDIQNTEKMPQIQRLSNSIDYQEQQINFDQDLNRKLGQILNFILSNMGKSCESEIQKFRNIYQEDPISLQIIDKLVMKYYSAKKTKEDIVRYILRRSFKIIKENIMKKEKVCPKKASILIYEKYFQVNFNNDAELSVDSQNDKKQALLNFFSPDKKVFKTINIAFVKEIFLSESFCQEYQRFLSVFPNILSYDNSKKKTKCLRFLVDCVKKDCLWKIGKYNRLPWLDTWIEDTKRIAKKLLSKKSIYKWKKYKK